MSLPLRVRLGAKLATVTEADVQGRLCVVCLNLHHSSVLTAASGCCGGAQPQALPCIAEIQHLGPHHPPPSRGRSQPPARRAQKGADARRGGVRRGVI